MARWECGRQFRITVRVLEAGPTCGVCGSRFENTTPDVGDEAQQEDQ